MDWRRGWLSLDEMVWWEMKRWKMTYAGKPGLGQDVELFVTSFGCLGHGSNVAARPAVEDDGPQCTRFSLDGVRVGKKKTATAAGCVPSVEEAHQDVVMRSLNSTASGSQAIRHQPGHGQCH